jgi:phosphate transport system permease protein
METPSPVAPAKGEGAVGGPPPRRPHRALRPGRWKLLQGLGRAFHGLTGASTVLVFGLIAALVYALATGAAASAMAFGPGFLVGGTWDPVHSIYGAGPLIAGTLLTSALALLLAVPVSLGVAIFLSEIAPPRLRRPLTYVLDLGAAVPSVVYGFWAFIVLVPAMHSTIEPALGALTGDRAPFGPASTGYDVLTATIVLAIMIIPTIAAISRESLRAVPLRHRESARSLGATRWETTRLGVLRPARGGIAAAIILGLGRAIGETIAVSMVIGNLFILPGTLFSPGSTLASWIVNNFTESPPGLERSAIFELALILLAVTLFVNIIARLLLRRFARQAEEPTTNGRLIHLPRHPHHLTATSLPGGDQVHWRARLTEEAHRRIRRRRTVQWVVIGLTILSVLMALLPFASLLYTAARLGGSAVVQPGFYTSRPPPGCNPAPGVSCSLGGIGPEIQGTAIMLGIAALIAVPLGLLAGIYLAEYGRGRFAKLVSFLADVMTGVPTIILGVFVYALFLYFDHAAALSALSGGVALGVLMLPIAMRASEEALRTVPTSLKEAALALGFPKHRVTLRVVLGSARGALVTGMLLAASRAAGDTAAILLTAGGSYFWFQGLSTQTAAITPFIFNNFGSNYQNLQTDAWGAALVLLAIMLAISLGARLLASGHGDPAEVD